jgi:hypothetical protein
MPRDPLLFLLAIAVLLNLALILGVVLIRLQAARPGASRGDRRPVRPGQRPAVGVVRRPSGATAVPAVPAAEPMLTRLAEPPPPPILESVEPATIVAASVAEAGATRPVTAASPTTRRARRFVLPKLEEDGARAERAIQAVLGEGPSTQSGDVSPAHRPRRRSRRHRPSGPAEHTALDIAVRGLDDLARRVGSDAADRLMEAVRGTIHAHLRSGDRTIDLGDGRLRVIVETDRDGATSAAERLRGLTAPWLAAAAVPLSLRIALPGPDAVAEGVAAS